MALLNGLGIVLVRRLDLAAVEHAKQTSRALPRADAPLQLIWTTIGVVGFVAVLVVVRDHTRLARYAYTSAAAGLVLLLLPAVPGVGATINGARLWIRVGPITVQPSEVAKILLMVFFASYLVAKRDVLVARQPPRDGHRPAARPRPRSGAGRLGGQHRRAGPREATSARRCCSSGSSW